jgi:hypothetical protein
MKLAERFENMKEWALNKMQEQGCQESTIFEVEDMCNYHMSKIIDEGLGEGFNLTALINDVKTLDDNIVTIIIDSTFYN